MNTEYCAKKQKRLNDDATITLAPHENLGSTLQSCIDTLRDHQRLNEQVKAKYVLIITYIQTVSFSPFFRNSFAAMPASKFNTAQHEINMYASAVKEDERMFNARNISFNKEYPLLNSLCIINPDNEQEYWGYAGGYIGALDKEDEIKDHIRMLDFLSQQLRLRLRTKSKAASVVREDVKTLKAMFKQIVDESRIAGDDSASL